MEPAHKERPGTGSICLLSGKGKLRSTIGVRWMEKKGIQWSPVELNFESKY